jgi:hypothetical protein
MRDRQSRVGLHLLDLTGGVQAKSTQILVLLASKYQAAGP